jgi:hypothetical protein
LQQNCLFGDRFLVFGTVEGNGKATAERAGGRLAQRSDKMRVREELARAMRALDSVELPEQEIQYNPYA